MASPNLAFVDRMRGLAILMVIALHYTQVFATPLIRGLFEFGQAGVQLFFVASAFTLCLSADNRRDEARPLRNFLIRRVFRIAPLYWLGILLYAAVFWPDREAAAFTPLNITANLLLIHGLVPAANNSIVPGGWTIGTEVLFYLLFPFAYAALDRAWQRHGRRALVLAFALALLISLGWQGWFRLQNGFWLTNNGFAYGALPTQLPVFVLGMVWYLAGWREGRMRLGLRRNLAGGLILLVACAGVIGGDVKPLFGLLPVLAGGAAVLLGNALHGGWLELPWLEEIGKVSYSLYILHFAVVWRPSAWVLHQTAQSPAAEWAMLVPLFGVDLALLFGAARLTRLWIEQPATRLAAKLLRPSEDRQKPAIFRLK